MSQTDQLNVQQAHIAELDNQLKMQRVHLDAAINEISFARRRPHLLLRDLLMFRLLRIIAKASPPLPRQMANRFAKSAKKRDPRRAIVLTHTSPVLGPITPTYPSPARKCIVVFSHEATRTGAPILSLNLMEKLSRKYDILSVTLLGGPLIGYFGERSFYNIQLDRSLMTHPEIEMRIMEILQHFKPEYAIVNSVVCYQVMSALKKNRTPSVALVHEFAADIPVYPYFSEVLDKSNRVIFSTELTLETLLRLGHMCRPPKVSILPQGQCKVPSLETDEVKLKNERELINRTFTAPDNEFIFVGLGSVHQRKGVDLFLEVARLMRARNEDRRFRFVWIGDGYSPQENEYSRFLRDQLQRSGLVDIVHFLPALAQLNEVYDVADALLLTSRLDPLPNVAIDMIAKSKPVFCFDKATGFAEILQNAGFADCVADYLSASDMADKVSDAMAGKKEASNLGIAQRKLIGPSFDINRYVEQIDTHGLSAQRDKDCFDKDVQAIIASGLFRRDFYEATHTEKSDRQLVEEYVSRCKSGRLARKAIPGFQPYIYAVKNDLKCFEDPLAHYLAAGCPLGPWQNNVITETETAISARSSKLNTALHVHAYYTETLSDIISRIELNANLPDLFISTCRGGKSAVNSLVSRYNGKVVSIREVPNVGRDIAPFLTEFGAQLSNYDIIGHVHTKQSNHIANRQIIEAWSNFAFGNMLGNQDIGGMLDRILAAFSRENIGIVFPDDPNIMAWTENKDVARPLARALKMNELPEYFNFPVGSMFWMNKTLFSRFNDLDLTWEDYPTEPLPIDGTTLHALERLFGALPQYENMNISVTNICGLTR